jgi:NitT/TauT family transport system substrate-binding protein
LSLGSAEEGGVTRLIASIATLAVFAAGLCSQAAQAEASEVRLSRGYGILYLPLYVMEQQKLIEKHAKAVGLGEVKVSWRMLDGGNVINDAMLAGALDVAAIGVPGFLTLWSKARGNARLAIIGLSGLSTTSLYLNTTNPEIKTLRDFTSKDKIALPGIKTSLSAVVLQMMVAKQFGEENYAKLDPLTVGLSHPDAYTALASGGKGGVNSHFGSPPYSILELEKPGVHRVLSSTDVLGPMTLDAVYTLRKFYEANPKLCKAIVSALDEANELIARDRNGAAQAYIAASGAKVSKEEVLRMLADPQTKFSTTPDGVMKFASFMHRVGIISVAPKDWKELFVVEVHGRPGS